jgi:hypothetical protein
MDREVWRKVDEIFHQALEMPPSQRDAWVEQACGGDAELRAEVTSLLGSDHEAVIGFVGAHVEHAVLDLLESAGPAAAGKHIGPYRLLRELGRGGMGTVWLAARADEQYDSEVAIKLVRPGLDTDFILRRFRRERQILAHLQHPHIARLFDGGTTGDRIPYLVMEYVDGAWITEYAKRQQLSVEKRLSLFLPVCSAVEYAHRAFIVHRDLKPANILVDRNGTPKLLDFGISKLLHAQPPDETQGAGPMTPDYACPEQISGGPVTIASDIYSLGAVLYELLTGKQPHHIEQCTPLGLERAICQAPLTPPSAAVRDSPVLSRRLAGDLDNIILRAMQKEPERRYASVEQLAADLQRHLNHLPVMARPDSPGYRAAKFVRRHRVTTVVTGSVLLAVLAVGGVTLHEAQIARTADQDAVARQDLTEAALSLAAEQARAGNRTQALETLDMALRLIGRIDASAPADSVPLRSRVAHSWRTAGLIYERLAGAETGEQRIQDRKTAGDWHQRALVQWRQLAARQELPPPQRQEMDATAEAIAALAKGDTAP